MVEVLAEEYGLDHEVTLFEAAPHPQFRSRIETFPLSQLPEVRMMSISTLYVPPRRETPIDPARMAYLGLASADITKTW